MTYLSLPRLTFAGLFEADVNTVNNDVRNFKASMFEPRFQTRMENIPGQGTEYNGWWNPAGSNSFRLLECVMTGAVASNGSPIPEDLALTLALDAQTSRTSAKIVDLDPQFQFASAIWGLRIAFMHYDKVAMSAELFPSSFRDIYFGRLLDAKTNQPLGGSSSASARFTGTLVGVQFEPAAMKSPILSALAEIAGANDNRLSMSLMTYGYRNTKVIGGFTIGSVIGSIGPWHRGEPLGFASGRRFAPDVSPNHPFAGASGIGFMNAEFTAGYSILSVDFGNSLPLVLSSSGAGPTAEPVIGPKQLGPLRVVALKQPDTAKQDSGGRLQLTAMTLAGQQLTPDQYEVIGVVDRYDSAWLRRTGGIVDLPSPEPARVLAKDHPLAILTEGGPSVNVQIAIRETVAGLWMRADDFVKRVDTAKTGWTSASSSIYAMRYGVPYPNAPIAVSLEPVTQGQGGTGDPHEVNPPQAPIPPINFPPDKVQAPSVLTADAQGIATLTFRAQDPGNPRGYVDGQIYIFDYAFAADGQSPMPIFDSVVAHVRDAFTPPQYPSWENDIAPIFIQYGNLYPIMSRGLFSLSDYSAVVANARLLYLAFSLPIEDPNYMPVTRDLSAGKRLMLISWLAGYLTGAPGDYGALPVLPAGALMQSPALPVITSADHPTHLSNATAEAALVALGGGNDGKTAAFRSFLSNSLRKPD